MGAFDRAFKEVAIVMRAPFTCKTYMCSMSGSILYKSEFNLLQYSERIQVFLYIHSSNIYFKDLTINPIWTTEQNKFVAVN